MKKVGRKEKGTRKKKEKQYTKERGNERKR